MDVPNNASMVRGCNIEAVFPARIPYSLANASNGMRVRPAIAATIAAAPASLLILFDTGSDSKSNGSKLPFWLIFIDE
jgi:hypothetical protein